MRGALAKKEKLLTMDRIAILSRPSFRVRYVILILILLLAFSLRIGGLKDHDIWWDEGASAYLARLPLVQMVDWTAHDVHPPLYFLILHEWWLVVGDGTFLLRFPSALMGVAAVALIFLLGKTLNGYWTGAFAAFLLAISRFAVTWSQETRMHTLATLLATIALWATIVMWRKGKWRVWVIYVLAAAAALYTFYLTISILIVTNLAFLCLWWWQRRSRRLLLYWGTAQIAAFLLFLPWILYAFPKMHAWAPEVPFSALFGVEFYVTTLTSGVTVDIQNYLLVTLLIMGILAVGMFLLWRSKGLPIQRANLILMALGLIVPALVVFALALPLIPGIGRPLTPRYFLPMAVCYYILVAWVASLLFQRRYLVGILFATLVVVVEVSGFSTFYAGRLEHDDFYTLTNTINAYLRPGDTVLLDDDQDWPLFVAKYPGAYEPVHSGQQMDAASADQFLSSLWNKSEAIWLVTTPHATQSDPGHAVPTWLKNHARSTVSWDYNDNNLALYVRTPERESVINDLAPGAAIPIQPQIDLGRGAKLSGTFLPLRTYETGRTLQLTLYWQQPPKAPFRIQISGPTANSVAIDPPTPADLGPTLQQVNLPLTPDMPGGEYRILYDTGLDSSVELDHFTLWSTSIGTTATPAIQNPLQLRFGDSIALVGYDLQNSTVAPGGQVNVTLYWQATAPIQKRYKVLVFVIGDKFNPQTGNPLWGQRDNEPVNWQAPTTLWPTNKTIVDTYGVALAPDTPPGKYQLGVVLYGYTDGIRLPIFDQNGKSLTDMYLLQPLTVAP
jgi:4-amino-4-deoxy-L-arabinose transferase-like glycosyltransferase